jgi:hypothetical protein
MFPPAPPPPTTRYSTCKEGLVVNTINPVPDVNLVYLTPPLVTTVSAARPVPTFIK